MSSRDFTQEYRTIGRITAWAVFVLGVLYVAITALGFLSLKSPDDPISDPYFTIMELLAILLGTLMMVSFSTVHAYAPPKLKAYSLAALVFMVILASITSIVHFSIMTVSRPLEAAGFTWAPFFFSFKWPSVAYALDILAWDWFFALAMLCAAPVFRGGALEKTVRILMIVTGLLSLAGLIGVPLADMNIRNIGIIGYAVVSPVVFLLLALLFGRAQPESAG